MSVITLIVSVVDYSEISFIMYISIVASPTDVCPAIRTDNQPNTIGVISKARRNLTWLVGADGTREKSDEFVYKNANPRRRSISVRSAAA